MSIQEFFKELENNPINWVILHGTIRCIIGDDYFCPITWVAYCRTGEKFHVFDFAYAGDYLGLDEDAIKIIASCADTSNSVNRTVILKACGLYDINRRSAWTS